MKGAGILLFWLALWQGLSMLVGLEYFLPSVPKTAAKLFSLIVTARFWRIAALTLLRVLTGLFSGIFLGALLAVLCHKLPFVNSLLSPIISVIKATPVATFIVLLWIMMSGTSLAILIAVLMVLPIVWQNLMDGFHSIDGQLEEVAYVFGFSLSKRIRLIIFPALKKYLAPAVITSVGLAWKSEIAAEIIAYTKNSVGQMINDAKYNLDTAEVFAWTAVIITFSILLERVAVFLLGRLEKR